MSTYLVFGATGNVGRRVAERLAWSGAAVRATSRNPAAAKLPRSVDVITPDLAAPGALDDVEAAFLMWPFHSAEPARPIVDALKRRVRHVVFMTGGGALPGVTPEEQPNPVARWHATVEQLIERSGMEWTVLSPSTFMTNTQWWSDQIRAGDSVRGAFGSLAMTPIHQDDIAAVAVHALTEPGHDRRRHTLTGPEVLTQAEQVRVIGEAIGRPLHWRELTPEQERARLLADPGFPDGFIDELLDGYTKMAAAPPPEVTSAVRDITGAPATTLSAWAAEHADDFGGDQR
ncbi:NAD(P)H-binding protein [Nonomuraea sp. NPDC048881]|uniref:NAD(P)H-binding protein n=1 Tax=Nonomuraea sp. NPDC048881 TaxID=3155030 RepID=UPI0033F2F2DE